jgi:hypothetical protein
MKRANFNVQNARVKKSKNRYRLFRQKHREKADTSSCFLFHQDDSGCCIMTQQHMENKGCGMDILCYFFGSLLALPFTHKFG